MKKKIFFLLSFFLPSLLFAGYYEEVSTNVASYVEESPSSIGTYFTNNPANVNQDMDNYGIFDIKYASMTSLKATTAVITNLTASYTATLSSHVNISGNLDVAGTFQAGTSNHILTNAAGLIDGEKIQDDTVDDDSIDLSDVTLADFTDDINNTVDTEWDTVAEIETATGFDIITSTQIDTFSELNKLVADYSIISSTQVDSKNELNALIGNYHIVVTTEVDTEAEAENMFNVDWATVGDVAISTGANEANIIANDADILALQVSSGIIVNTVLGGKTYDAFVSTDGDRMSGILYMGNENGIRFDADDTMSIYDNAGDLIINADSNLKLAVGGAIKWTLSSGGVLSIVALDMNATSITNIGHTGTDFDGSGGLTLASNLTMGTDQVIFGTGRYLDDDPTNFEIDISTSINVAGDVRGTTIGDITEANLVDKSATETISGSWTFGTTNLIVSTSIVVAGDITTTGDVVGTNGRFATVYGDGSALTSVDAETIDGLNSTVFATTTTPTFSGEITSNGLNTNAYRIRLSSSVEGVTQIVWADGTVQISSPTAGEGDMSKATYDTDTDDIIDNSETLGGHTSTYFGYKPEWSFIIIPDSQYVVSGDTIPPTNFATECQWIVDNADALNLKFVLHVGDIVNNWDNIEQWNTAVEGLLLIEDANIPMFICRGNHDDEGGSLPQNFNYYINYSSFYASNDWFDGGFQSIDASSGSSNMYGKLTIEGDNFLIMNLRYRPSATERSWALAISTNNPTYKVITLTHEYLGINAGTGENAISPVGKTVWDDFVKKSSNTIMNICGHWTNYGRRIDFNDGGRAVNSIKYNRHDTSGYLKIVTVNPNTKEMRLMGIGTIGIYANIPDTGGSNDKFTMQYDYLKPTLLYDKIANPAAGFSATNLTGNKILYPGTDTMYQYLGTSNVDRNVYLDTSTASTGDQFILRHNDADTENNKFTIYGGNVNIIDYLYAGGMKKFIYNGTNWISADPMTGDYTNKLNLMGGYNANAYGGGIAFGYYSTAYTNGISIGSSSQGYSYGLALGGSAIGYTYGVALGYLTYGLTYGTGVGAYARARNYGVSVGYRAGATIASGAVGNTILGAQSGTNITTGDYNIIMGYGVDCTTTTGSSTLNIGNLIYGTDVTTSSIISSGYIGIGTPAPQAKLDIAGAVRITGNLDAASGTLLISTATFYGDVSKPNQSGCYAYQASASSQAVPNNSTVQLVLNAEIYDSQNEFDTTTSTFTVATAGKYILIASSQLDNSYSGADTLFTVSIVLNGSTIASTGNKNDSNSTNVMTSTIMDLNANDKIWATIKQSSGQTEWLSTNAASKNRLNIEKLR